MIKETVKTVNEIKEFYSVMDNHVFNYHMRGSNSINNISSNIYQSISETFDSISLVLKEERIPDAYILLRKAIDLICLDLYLNLYSITEVNLDNFVDNAISNWMNGKHTTKGFKFVNSYIIDHYPHSKIKRHFYPDGVYEKSRIDDIKKKTNYSIHFKDISYFFTNSRKQKLNLEGFLSDVKYILKYHITLLVTITEYYFTSTDYVDYVDYVDYLDMGMSPPEGSQYWVPDYFQEILKHYIYHDDASLYKSIKMLVDIELEEYK